MISESLHDWIYIVEWDLPELTLIGTILKRSSYVTLKNKLNTWFKVQNFDITDFLNKVASTPF